MGSNAILFITLALINSICMSLAFDPSPLQDFCVADATGKGGCKDPNTVTANDFFLGGLDRPANTSFNEYGVGAVAFASVATVPGFNTLGITATRGVIAPNGIIPPHSHLRASEVIYVEEGVVEVGFITSYPDYKYYTKILNKGDVFIFPVGLVHTGRNLGRKNCVIFGALNSQNPGFNFIPDAVLAAKPAVNSTYLSKAFKLDEKTIKDLQTKSWFSL
ncbi:putative germin-like protein 2-1 [Salvia miltiorrhiza]|uniref:putative germin-like protein 2-1 n=1 Tax=Salvia miltiorrhiza TaxID=226208 RepID=UPI0025AD6F95|nr:putative germin-like protein 2-1 [Salvia miltiorrhiza]